MQNPQQSKRAVLKMLQDKISYGYYFSDYGMGSTPVLSDKEFAVYEMRAREFLRGVCTGEIPTENRDDVAACVCAIAEEMYSQKKSCNIKSENIDGYSVTYTESRNTQKDLSYIARLYLGHLGILYAGVE